MPPWIYAVRHCDESIKYATGNNIKIAAKLNEVVKSNDVLSVLSDIKLV